MKKTFSILLLVIICSCNNNDHKSGVPFNLEAVKRIIQDKNEIYRTAYLSGDSATFAELHHGETINMPPGTPLLFGKAAIGGSIRMVPNQGIKNMIINTTSVYGGPDDVIEEGKFEIVTPSDTYPGKYIVIWKQESGTWKIYRAIWNMDFK